MLVDFQLGSVAAADIGVTPIRSFALAASLGLTEVVVPNLRRTGHQISSKFSATNGCGFGEFSRFTVVVPSRARLMWKN